MHMKNDGNAKYMFLLSFILYIFSLTVSAQTEISDSLIKVRIRQIQTTLKADKSATTLWWYGWFAGYSTATLVQGTVGALSDSKRTRQDMFLGAITTSLGAIGQFLTPVVPDKAIDSLSGFRENSIGDSIFKLKYAEELLKIASEREKEARSWITHAETGIVNVSSGLITWLGFKRSIWAGVANFAINSAVTEIQIWSTPTKAMRDYKNYCKEYYSGNKLYSQLYSLRWYVNFYPGIIQIRFEF